MYIFITEGGAISKQKEITEGDCDCADDGYLRIIDISDPDDPKEFGRGEWFHLT